MTTFSELGFPSSEAERNVQHLREEHHERFARVEILLVGAMLAVQRKDFAASRTYLVGVGYWLRCIEACQGAVLLIERGMPAAPYSVIRTAFECLFIACAVWRKPELLDKLEGGHHSERIKQAVAMVKAGAQSRVPPEQFAELKKVAETVPPSLPGLSFHDAAVVGGFEWEYQHVYRGLALAGAHATVRSLDDFVEEQSDGSFSIGFESSPNRIAFQLTWVADCLEKGMERHENARLLG
jgi:hypothetical protein